MIFFFIFSSLIFALVIFTCARKLFFSKDGADDRENYYAEQLKKNLNDVFKEFKNSQISEDEYRGTKFEIEKRILKEIRSKENLTKRVEKAPKILSNIFLFLGLPVLILSTGLIYYQIGNYGFQDQNYKKRDLTGTNNFANRLNQKKAEILLMLPPKGRVLTQQKQDYPQLKVLVERLQIILQNRPKDLQGYNLLVDNSARLGDYKTSYQGQRHIVEVIKPTVSAEDYGKLAELMIAAADGYVSIEAEENIKKSLHIDSHNQRSRYYFGLLKVQKNKLEEGYAIWKKLLEEGPADVPWNQLIRKDIRILEEILDTGISSIEYPRIFEEDENSGTREMIDEMVSSLNERLEAEGGPYEDWSRLIKSYLVLGKNHKASEILKKAKAYFKDRPKTLRKLNLFEPLMKNNASLE